MFRTRYGHFKYIVMPFRLINIPVTFQAYINKALIGLLNLITVMYIDNILVFSYLGKNHTEHVRMMLLRLRKYSLYIKLLKCEFFTDTVDFLGYCISVTGVLIDPSRVQAILEWPAPTSFRKIQVFLGFTNFYRGFMIHYLAVIVPITDLLIRIIKGKKLGPFK